MYYCKCLETVELPLEAVEPSAEIRRSILFFAHRYARPFFLGNLANDIGWSLKRTEQHVQYLVREGILRKLSPEEVQGFSFVQNLQIYTLSGSLNAQAAHHV